MFWCQRGLVRGKRNREKLVRTESVGDLRPFDALGAYHHHRVHKLRVALDPGDHVVGLVLDDRRVEEDELGADLAHLVEQVLFVLEIDELHTPDLTHIRTRAGHDPG